MFELTTIPHSEISSGQLDQIIQIKSMAWPYSFKEQNEWIQKNIKDSDIHIFLLNEQKQVVAYLNLIDIELSIDEQLYPAYGIGNVCALKKGEGWGKELILKTNEFLIEKKRIGLLFCKDPLSNFYNQNHWRIIAPDYFRRILKNGIHAFLYNGPVEFNKLAYNGPLF